MTKTTPTMRENFYEQFFRPQFMWPAAKKEEMRK
jgi:hypothetical protein